MDTNFNIDPKLVDELAKSIKTERSKGSNPEGNGVDLGGNENFLGVAKIGRVD